MNTILLIVFTFIIVETTYGQRFNGGFLTGLSLSQIDGDGWSGYTKPGLIAGGFVNTQFKNRIKAQYEVKYIQKGARERFNLKEPNTSKTHLEYLEMPVTVNYSLKKDSFAIEGGLLLARLIRSRGYDSFGETPLAKPYHKFDLGIILGGSYKINQHLWINARYTYSLIRIRKIEFPLNGWWWYFRGDYNNVISAALFYEF